MNNFEKRFVLDCFEKLLSDIRFTSSCFEDFLNVFIEEFNIKKEIFKEFNPSYEEYNPIDTRFLRSNKLQNKFRKLLKSIIISQKLIIKPKTCLLEKQILILKDIFNLSDKEYKLFLFITLKETCDVLGELVDCFGRHDILQLINKLISCNTEERAKLLENMYFKKLLEKVRFDINIDDYWYGILNNNLYNTKEKIVAKIMGQSQKSTLKAKDFEHIKNEFENAVKILSASVKERKKGVNILLYGNVGTGKTEFAKLIANSSNIFMYAVGTEKDGVNEADREDRLVDLYAKQFILENSTNSCILFDEAEDVMNTGFSFFNRTASKGYLNKILETNSVPVIWTTNNIEDVDPAFLRRMTYTIEFEKLPETSRLNIWKNILKKYKIKVKKEKLEELNKTYDVSPSIISNAVSTAKMLNGDINDVEKFIQNVAQVIYKRKNISKTDIFKENEYNINLVNADMDMDNLTEKIKKAGKLNFSMCLYGEPGTGKSLYAKYLANNLGIEVVMKKASDLMSKWVGGTEKNIARAFAEAKDKKAMLIIDEADSFLQNRNNAYRNWEVTQVNEMLTWMESHQYPFVCTTNLVDRLDEASLRRFTFKVKFDFMKSEQVNSAIEHFFGIKDANVNIKGLTAGDFATVKKKTDFLGTTDINEITQMLNAEVKVKKSSELKSSVGF